MTHCYNQNSPISCFLALRVSVSVCHKNQQLYNIQLHYPWCYILSTVVLCNIIHTYTHIPSCRSSFFCVPVLLSGFDSLQGFTYSALALQQTPLDEP